METSDFMRTFLAHRNSFPKPSKYNSRSPEYRRQIPDRQKHTVLIESSEGKIIISFLAT